MMTYAQQSLNRYFASSVSALCFLTSMPRPANDAWSVGRSLMGWEDLDVVDPEAEKAKRGEETDASGLLEQVWRPTVLGRTRCIALILF